MAAPTHTIEARSVVNKYPAENTFTAEVTGGGFRFITNDFFETQVLRLGYTYKF